MNTRHKVIKKGKLRFERFIEAQKEANEKLLPITHTTDAYDLGDIIENGEIRPRPCDVLDHDLSYFFYGRPAYRKNSEIQANNLAAYAPIVLIFKSTVSDKAIAAFPFDSGAFKGEMYSEFTHHRMAVQDFGLQPSHRTIGKLVAFFFGTNSRYYNQNPRAKRSIQADEFEAQTYQELVTFRGKNQRDDRSTTVELLLDECLKLQDNLLAVIVPSSMIKDRAVKAKLSNLDVHIRSYTDGANLTPASQVPLLSDVVRHFYIEQGILEK
ncbi:hypothetical protein [uncultured Bradyrhizobium sp.]|uniref:hypothetical protein n=1 Tax=uncultured Bradyrhizobium sp. TaxID=199684 RepID=UPI0035C9E2F1